MKGLTNSQLKNITSKLNKIYPLKYADNSWDNTGLLIDSSIDEDTESSHTGKNKILLTIDLTQSVAQEAIEKGTNLIVSYHPFLFRKINKINRTDPQQNSMIKLIKNNISVYSPHTAVDATKGGVNDWLADSISQGSKLVRREVIEPNKEGVADVGMGRLVEFEEKVSLIDCINRVKSFLNLKFVQFGCNEGLNKEIKSIAICAGSGGSVFKNIEADLYFTGELSHHEGLFFKENGSAIIVCNHSNTERGYLTEMKKLIEESLGEAGYEVVISETDEDVYRVV